MRILEIAFEKTIPPNEIKKQFIQFLFEQQNEKDNHCQ